MSTGPTERDIPMFVRVVCPACGHAGRVDGRLMRCELCCGNCHQVFTAGSEPPAAKGQAPPVLASLASGSHGGKADGFPAVPYPPSGAETAARGGQDEGGISMATASATLGLLGLLNWCLPIIGLPLSMIGLVLGLLRLGSRHHAMALRGVVLNAIGILLSLANAAAGANLVQLYERLQQNQVAERPKPPSDGRNERDFRFKADLEAVEGNPADDPNWRADAWQGPPDRNAAEDIRRSALDDDVKRRPSNPEPIRPESWPDYPQPLRDIPSDITKNEHAIRKAEYLFRKWKAADRNDEALREQLGLELYKSLCFLGYSVTGYGYATAYQSDQELKELLESMSLAMQKLAADLASDAEVVGLIAAYGRSTPPGGQRNSPGVCMAGVVVSIQGGDPPITHVLLLGGEETEFLVECRNPSKCYSPRDRVVFIGSSTNPKREFVNRRWIEKKVIACDQRLVAKIPDDLLIPPDP